MKVRGIFQKIVIPMVLIVCMFGVTILMLIINMFMDTYEKQIFEENTNTAGFVAQSVESFMDMAYRVTEEAAGNEAVLSMNTEQQTPVLQNTAKHNEYFELVYVQDMNGDQTGRSSGTLGNRANRWWFIEMLEKNKPFVSKSYYSISTNMACASIFIPIVKDNKTIGIFATDIKLEGLQDIAEEYSDISKGKVSFVLDGEGVVVAHPESVYYEELYNYRSMTRTVTKKDAAGNILYDAAGNIITEELAIEISEEYQSIVDEVLSGKQGEKLITDSGKEYYISYAPVTLDGDSDSWAVITLHEKKQALTLLYDIVGNGIIITVVAIVLAVVFIAFISRTITRPVKRSLDMLTRLSEGDLDIVVPDEKGRDEMAELVRALGKTITILKSIISDINTNLSQLADGNLILTSYNRYPGQFDDIGQSLGRIRQSMNSTISTIAVHSNKLAESSDAISTAANSLSRDAIGQASAVEQLAASVSDTSERITTNADITKKVNDKMAVVNNEMMASNTSVNELTNAMNEIYSNSQRINGISKLIQDISFQTNLLSMNASVEASRAGEAGKGFSVIASEIRALAERCSAAAADTAELIKTTQTSLENGQNILEETAKSIHITVEGSAEVSTLISKIAEATAEQSEAVSQISRALAQISNAVQSNSAISEENAALSIDLADNAGKLKELLGRYKY